MPRSRNAARHAANMPSSLNAPVIFMGRTAQALEPTGHERVSRDSRNCFAASTATGSARPVKVRFARWLVRGRNARTFHTSSLKRGPRPVCSLVSAAGSTYRSGWGSTASGSAPGSALTRPPPRTPPGSAEQLRHPARRPGRYRSVGGRTCCGYLPRSAATRSRTGSSQVREIRLPPGELRSWAWCDRQQAGQRLSALLARRVAAAVEARDDGGTADLENGYR